MGTGKRLFPPRPLFKHSEIGDCTNNGDADMKKLSPTCGCPNETKSGPNVHRCCRPHLLKLLRDVYREIIVAGIPMMIIDGALIGWYRNKKLVPYDLDIDATLHYKYWDDLRYTDALKRIASRGYCVWLRTPVWTKIWSSVHALDIFPHSIVDHKDVDLWSPIDAHNPYNKSILFPGKIDVLEDAKVIIPNRPTDYLDQNYGKGKWIKPWP